MIDHRSDHRIAIDVAAGVRFVCDAPVGGECRLRCVAECEDYHLKHCDRSVKDTGECGALPYLESEETFDTYIGSTEPDDWQSGPIDTEWDGFHETWVWRFPGEDRELPGRRRYQRAV